MSAALDHGIVVRRMILESLRLEGKVALINGGDEGMRRAIALRLAAEGADIALCHRSNSRIGYWAQGEGLRHAWGSRKICRERPLS